MFLFSELFFITVNHHPILRILELCHPHFQIQMKKKCFLYPIFRFTLINFVLFCFSLQWNLSKCKKWGVLSPSFSSKYESSDLSRRHSQFALNVRRLQWAVYHSLREMSDGYWGTQVDSMKNQPPHEKNTKNFHCISIDFSSFKKQ